MHVLLSAYAISPTRGSEAGFAWQLTERLASLGHRVTLLTTRRFQDEHADAAALLDGLSLVYVDDRVPTVLARGQLGVYARYVAWQRRSAHHARALLNDPSSEIAVVHHYSWGQLNTGSPLATLPTPFVFGPTAGATTTPKVLMPLLTRRQRAREALRTAAVRSVRLNPAARRVIQRSTIVLAANKDAERAIVRLGGRPRVLMPECLPDSWFSDPPAVRLDPHKLVWVGRAMPRKALNLAVMTMAELPEAYRLRVCGDGPALPSARQLASDLGVADRVEFLGSIPWKQVLAEYDEASALLFTSARDSFGMQVLEAASRGLPTVGIQHQGIGDHLPEDAGVLVPLQNPTALAKSLAEAIVLLAGDTERRRRLEQGAREFAQAHTADRLFQEILHAYAAATHNYK